MHTMYDYITHIKGVEYILALACIAGYLLFSEVLKARPFATVKSGGKEDLEYMRQMGSKGCGRRWGG